MINKYNLFRNLSFYSKVSFLKYNNRNKNPRKWYKIKTKKKCQLINIFLFIKGPILNVNENKNRLTIT